MAWQARALSLLCCIQRFLTDEPSQDLRFNGSEDALRYARRAQYALIADGEHDLLGSALAADGEPGTKKPGSEEPGSKGEKGLARTLLLAEVRMNRLDQKSYSIMLELIGRVLAGMIRAFNDKQNEAIHAPDEDEDEEYDDDDDDEKDRAKGHRPYSVKLESEELSDFDETIQEMASSIEACEWTRRLRGSKPNEHKRRRRSRLRCDSMLLLRMKMQVHLQGGDETNVTMTMTSILPVQILEWAGLRLSLQAHCSWLEE